jgi:phosphonate transport system substrate-binding protein
MFITRFLWLELLLLMLSACAPAELSNQKKIVVGVVSYGNGGESIQRFAGLKTQLESQLKMIVELEPTFNEVQAVQQVERQAWDVVFAPPGLAAIAISQKQYLPILTQLGGEKERSVIVVKATSPAKTLRDLANQSIALGQRGSATGYYLPLYNLYGMTLSEVRFAPTPKTILTWVDQSTVAAGALSVAELDQYRSEFGPNKFRILYHDGHPVPAGSVLIGPTIDRNEQRELLQAMETVSPDIASEAGYVSNANPPDYNYLIKVVKRVRPIAQHVKRKPAALY